MVELPPSLLITAGVIGTLGSATIMITDWIGWTRGPDEGASQRLDRDLIAVPRAAADAIMTKQTISRSRKIVAAWLGGLAMGPTALGFVTVYALLSPAGWVPAFLAAFLLAMMMITGSYQHAGMAMMNEIVRVADRERDDTKAHATARELMDVAFRIWWPFVKVGALTCYLLGSLLYSVLVVFFQTGYPWWAGLLNPFLISFVISSSPLLPWRVRRWTGPAHVHLFSTLPLLGFSTFLVWHQGDIPASGGL